MTSLRDIIFGNLNSALEGGFFDRGEYLDGVSPEELAADMIAHAADVEHCTIEQILPFVKEWLELKKVLSRIGF